MDLAGIQNPKPVVFEQYQDIIKALRKFTSVRMVKITFLKKLSILVYVW